MISYILVAYFLQTGQSYIERDRLSLEQCAAQAAMARTAAAPLFSRIGEVRFLCIKEVLE